MNTEQAERPQQTKGHDMTTMETSDARRECDSHVEELERFDEWVGEFVHGSNCEDLAGIAGDEDEDADRRDLARHALAWMVDNGADELSWSAFVNGALDVEVNGRLDSTGWEVTDVALLVSFGGPTVRLVTDDADTIRVEVSWWGDQASTVLRCGLANELWEIGFERSQAVAR